MAQLGARLNGIEEVEGSNPSGSTDPFSCSFSNFLIDTSILGAGIINNRRFRLAGVVDHPTASWEREVGAQQSVLGTPK